MKVLPPGWRLTTVGEVCTYYKGGTPFEKLEYSAGGIPVLAKGDIKAFGRLEHSGSRFVSAAVVAERKFYLTQPGDFLMTTRDLTQAGDVLGLIARVPDERQYLVNQGVNVVRFGPEVDWRYLVYWTNAPMYRAHMRANAVGSTQIHIRKEAFTLAPLVLPPRPVQQQIADVLGRLDANIDLNRRMNQTLEALARALFNSWFMDFDPVRAKAEGRHPEGMDAETAALFPSQFVASELGEIPEGWKLAPLAEVMDVNPQRALSKGAVAPYLDMANMPTSSARAGDVIPREFGSGMRFVNGDTLLARITPCLENGKTAYVDFLESQEVGWGSTEYIVLRPRAPLPTQFAYFLARTDEFRRFAISNMAGTSGRQRVPTDCLNGFKLVVPPSGLADKFGRLAESFIAGMKANDSEAHTLAQMRDLLLPKLLSGEIRVRDAEAKVAAIA